MWHPAYWLNNTDYSQQHHITIIPMFFEVKQPAWCDTSTLTYTHCESSRMCDVHYLFRCRAHVCAALSSSSSLMCRSVGVFSLHKHLCANLPTLWSAEAALSWQAEGGLHILRLSEASLSRQPKTAEADTLTHQPKDCACHSTLTPLQHRCADCEGCAAGTQTAVWKCTVAPWLQETIGEPGNTC